MKWVGLVLVAATLGATATEVARVGPRELAARRGARRGLKHVAAAQTEQIATDADIVVDQVEETPRRSGRRGSAGTQSSRAGRGRPSGGRPRQRTNNRAEAESSAVVLDTAEISQDRQESLAETPRARRPRPRKTRVGPKRSRVQVSLDSEGETVTESPTDSELATDSEPAEITQDDEGSPSSPSPSTGRRNRKMKRPSLGRLSLRRKGNVQAEVTTEPPLLENLTPEQEPEEMALLEEGKEAIESSPNEEDTRKTKRPSLRRRPSLKRKGPSAKTTTTEAPPVVDDSQLKETKPQGKFKGLRNRRPSLNNRSSNRRNKASLDNDVMEKVVSEVVTEDESISVLAPEPIAKRPMEEFSRTNINTRISQTSRNQFQIRIPTTSPEPIRLTRTRSRNRQAQSSRSSQGPASQSRQTTSPGQTVENADSNQQTFTTNTRSSRTRNRSSRPSTPIDTTSSAHEFRKTSSSRRQPIPVQTGRTSHSHLQVTDHTTGRIEESQRGSRRRDRTKIESSRGTLQTEISRESSRQPEHRQGTAIDSVRGRKRIGAVPDVEMPQTTVRTQSPDVLSEPIFDDAFKMIMESEKEDTMGGINPEVSTSFVDQTTHLLPTIEITTTPALQSTLEKMSHENMAHETHLEGGAEISGTVELPRHRFEIGVDNQTTTQTDSVTPEIYYGEEVENNRSLPDPSIGIPLPLLNAAGKHTANKENAVAMIEDNLSDSMDGTKHGEIALTEIDSFANVKADQSLTLSEGKEFSGFLPDNLGATSNSDTSHLFGVQEEQFPKSSLPDAARKQSPRNFQPDVAREQPPVSYGPDAGEEYSLRSSLPEDTEEHSSTAYLSETADIRHTNAPASRTSSRSRSRSRSSDIRGSLQQQHLSVGTSATGTPSSVRGASPSSRRRQGTQHQPSGHTTSRDSTAQVRIQQNASRGSTGRGRIQHDTSRDSTARGRIQQDSSRGSTARGRIQQDSSRGSRARGRTQQETSQGSSARERIQQETFRSRQTTHSQFPEDINHPAESFAGSQDFSFTRERAQNLDLTDSTLSSAQSIPHEPRRRGPTVSNEQAVSGRRDNFADTQIHPQTRITETSVFDSVAANSSPTDYPPIQFEEYETETIVAETEPAVGDYLDIGEASAQDTTTPMLDKLEDETPLMTDDTGFGNEMLDDLTTTDLPEEMKATMPMLSDGDLGVSEDPGTADMNVDSAKKESSMHNDERRDKTQFTDETSADLFDVQSRFAQPRPVATTAPPLPVESTRTATFTRTQNTPRTNVDRGSIQRTHQPQRERNVNRQAPRPRPRPTGEGVPSSFGRRTSRGRLIQ